MRSLLTVVIVFVAVFMLLRLMPLSGYFPPEMIKEADEATRMVYLRNQGLLDHPMVQLGRHGAEADIARWCRTGLHAVTNLEELWHVDVLTDQPAAQVYTGNWLDGSPMSKSGRSYNDYDGVAIECQGLPDAPNHSNFPSQLLTPTGEYNRVIFFAFSVL